MPRKKISTDDSLSNVKADYSPLNIPPPDWLVEREHIPRGFAELRKTSWGKACCNFYQSNVRLIKKGDATEKAKKAIGKIYNIPPDNEDDEYVQTACLWRWLLQLDAHITVNQRDAFVGMEGKISKQWESTKAPMYGETFEHMSYKKWVSFWKKHIGNSLKKMEEALLFLDASNMTLRRESIFSSEEEVRLAIKQIGYDKHGLLRCFPTPIHNLGHGLFLEGASDEQREAIQKLKEAIRNIKATAPVATKRLSATRVPYVIWGLHHKGGLTEKDIADLLIESQIVWSQEPCPGFMDIYRRNLQKNPQTAQKKLIDQVDSILKRYLLSA